MHDNRVYPIAMHQVDWSTYRQVIKETLGNDPARTAGDLQSPASFNMSLPQCDLAQSYLGFLYVSDDPYSDKIVLTFADSRIKVTRLAEAPPYSIYVLGGSVEDFRITVSKHSKGSENQTLRGLANTIYSFIQAAGYRLWAGTKKQKLSDGTFIIKET